MGQKVSLIQAKKISFVETGKNAEYSIWGTRKYRLGQIAGHLKIPDTVSREIIHPRQQKMKALISRSCIAADLLL